MENRTDCRLSSSVMAVSIRAEERVSARCRRKVKGPERDASGVAGGWERGKLVLLVRAGRWKGTVRVGARVRQRRPSAHEPVRAGHPLAARAAPLPGVRWRALAERIQRIVQPERAPDAPVDGFGRERVVDRRQQMVMSGAPGAPTTTVRIEADHREPPRPVQRTVRCSRPKRTPEALLERKICIVVVVGGCRSRRRCGELCLLAPGRAARQLAAREETGQIGAVTVRPLARVVHVGQWWRRLVVMMMMMVMLLLLLLLLLVEVTVGIGPGRERGRWLAEVQRFGVGQGGGPEGRHELTFQCVRAAIRRAR
uniref:Uncharacterized protein n=1 Tax=Anopheles atroparvus TaxID=41427 RepID=A0A182J750_ANOAO